MRRPAKRRAKRSIELRRQVDLRHEHERLPAAREHRVGRAQVDLGLAAAGDAVQQDRARRGGDASAASIALIAAACALGQRRLGLGIDAARRGALRFGGERLVQAAHAIGQRGLAERRSSGGSDASAISPTLRW